MTATALRPLIDSQTIQTRISELAQAIRNDFAGEEILAVAVLKGSFLFHADLCRQLGDEVSVDFVVV